MKVKGEKQRVAALLPVIALIGLLSLACGCSSNKTATQSTIPVTSPGASDSLPQNSSTSTGTSSSEAALEQAKAEGKPVLVKFGSGKCIPCKQIEENINKIKPEYDSRVAFVIVDVYDQHEQNLTNQYGIQTIPTTFFLGKDGTIVDKVVGVMEPDQLKQKLDSLL